MGQAKKMGILDNAQLKDLQKMLGFPVTGVLD
jgi:hypothetical protein